MADVWKSQGRYFCEICKVWMADNRASRDIHEGGTKHKEMVKQKIKEQTEKAKLKEKQKKMAEASLAAMERAALESMKKHGDAMEHGPALPSFGLRVFDPKQFKDVKSMAEEMARRKREKDMVERVEKVNEAAAASAKVKSEHWQSEQQRTGSKAAEAASSAETVWVEADAEDGRKYYWHMYNGATVWAPPGKFYTAAEYKKKLDELDKTHSVKKATKTKRTAEPEKISYVQERQPKFPRMEDDVPKQEDPADTTKTEPEETAAYVEDMDGIPLPESIPLPGECLPAPVKTEEPAEVEEQVNVKIEPLDSEEAEVVEPSAVMDAGSAPETETRLEPEPEPETAKPSALGAWVRVKKTEEKKSDSFVSPLTAKYRAEEARERRAEEDRAKSRKDVEPKIVFEEKIAAVTTKKVKVIEFKKKSGPKNVRKRDA